MICAREFHFLVYRVVLKVRVYRLHTNKYPALNSHQPALHKISVVNTMIHRESTIPSSEVLKAEQASYVQENLKMNGYPFIENATQSRSVPQNQHLDPVSLHLPRTRLNMDYNSLISKPLSGPYVLLPLFL